MDWTADDEAIGGATDALATPDALVRWGRRLEVLGPRAAAADEAELAAAHALRGALHAVFSAVARGDDPSRDAFDLLARTHAEAASRGHLVSGGGAFTLDWPAGEQARVRFAVAVDAVSLLGDPSRLGRVHRCPGRNCGWLFLDTSGRRRWCSMSTCGSREKMRRMYDRRRARGSRG